MNNGKNNPLFPSKFTTDNDDQDANFDTIFSNRLIPPFHNIISSSSSSLFPHHQQYQPLFPIRRRFDDTTITTTPTTILPKPEPSDHYYLPPFPTTTTTSSSQKRPLQLTTSTLARQRRTRISDKTRCLQKLIPLDRQMDTATLYDETYKYVKFLEAQITVLQSMPAVVLLQLPTTTTTTTTTTHLQLLGGDDVYGGMCRLNRQQMLQVLVSSQVAQTVMYTNGWCVFSAEQLAALLHGRGQQVVEQRFI